MYIYPKLILQSWAPIFIYLCIQYTYIYTYLNSIIYTCIWYYEIWAFSQHLIFPKIYHTAWTRTARTDRGRKSSSSSTRVSWRAIWTWSMWRINFHSVSFISFLQCHIENVGIDVCQFLQWQFLLTSWAAQPNCAFIIVHVRTQFVHVLKEDMPKNVKGDPCSWMEQRARTFISKHQLSKVIQSKTTSIGESPAFHKILGYWSIGLRKTMYTVYCILLFRQRTHSLPHG